MRPCIPEAHLTCAVGRQAAGGGACQDAGSQIAILCVCCTASGLAGCSSRRLDAWAAGGIGAALIDLDCQAEDAGVQGQVWRRVGRQGDAWQTDAKLGAGTYRCDMKPWTYTFGTVHNVYTCWRCARLTYIAAPALRQCAGVQHCDCSVHTGGPALGISGSVNEDEGLWGDSTVRRGGLGSTECPVACNCSSRPHLNCCSLQFRQAGAAAQRGFTLGGNSNIQGVASRIHSCGSWVAVCGAQLDCDAGLPIENNAWPPG